ncbi:MAG: hypothetical protein OXO51_11540, partial [Gemmatimonadota bacterium]|nr:hypothetical protein [Gemmatimonadota bacterium]
GPILLYGLLFQSGPDSARMLSNVPWWPVVLLVALVALLSLLHGTTGVSVQKQPDKRKGTGAAADPSGPPGQNGQNGQNEQNGDPLRCTIQERSLNGTNRVETNR